MKQYKIGVFFEKGYLVSSQINLVTEDYKSTEFIFEFDIEEGRKVFELKKPDGSKYIKDIINNKITLVDYDTELNEISLISTAGTYEFEIVNYTEDSKLTLQEHGHFEVRGEIVEVNDSEVEKDTRLPILDSLINDVEGLKTDINSSVENATEQATYAKAQGDYAKKQAQIIIDANTTATKIINDFETNVDEYTKDFNTNAEEKLEAYNQNDIDKTKAYNKNAESKENSYNENASNKLKEYNDNATTKLSEYNSNSETKTKAFNTNASEKTDAFNLNVTNKTTDFNSNAEAKTTEFNDNATTKTEEYNTNAEAKVNEFNTNVDELKQDVEDCYNNMLTNEVEGTSIHVEDSANARIISLESEGNSEQVSTTGKNKLDISYLPISETESILNGGSYNFDEKTAKLTLNATNASSTMTVKSSYKGSRQLLLKAGTYYSQVRFNAKKVSDGTSMQYTEGVINVEEDVYIVQWYITCVNGLTKTIYPQIEEGSVATEYEPYTGGQPSPSPDYPQEIEVVEAYNLFDKTTITEGYRLDSSGAPFANVGYFISDFIMVEANMDYCVNYTITEAMRRLCFYDKDFNFISGHTSGSTFKTPENAKYIRLGCDVRLLDSIQVGKGSYIKPYIPYGCIEIKSCCDKNLFNPNDIKNNVAPSATSGQDVSVTPSFSSDYIEVSNNICYFKWEPGTLGYLFCYDENYNHLGNTANTNGQITSSIIYPKVKYVRVRFDTTYREDLNIIVSNEDIPYEPYQGSNLDINLQGNFMAKNGDIADTLRVENGRAILTKRVGKFVPSSKTNIVTVSSPTQNNSKFYAIDGTGLKAVNNNLTSISSNIFTGKTANGLWNSDIKNYCSVNVNGSVHIRVDSSLATIEDVKQFLIDNNVYFIGTLAEPYEVDLGKVDMPKTFEGVTNVSLISNLESNMKLKYVRSTNIVVDNLTKAIVAMGGEINV